MRLAAEAAIKEQTRLAQSEIEMEVAKKAAMEELSEKERRLLHSSHIIDQLKDLCRELQNKIQQVSPMQQMVAAFIIIFDKADVPQ